jgi:transposase
MLRYEFLLTQLAGFVLRYQIRPLVSSWSSHALTRSSQLRLDQAPAVGRLRAPHDRKNYLFVGNDEAGANLAGLFSLLATCEANGVNPEQYLSDVLPRLASHPNSRLDELLPHRWQPMDSS